ncbi:hypothetical protein [Wenyingzhuangia marina]|uniref:Uncharacterized protein n=1 Tax=Wenyingzhuangia marina TaxID=1195760 RepID=A0A1M5UER9_9FLAO|nr:hypothetical protein [Wenyingzhuangia marina]GGF68168.1 hypothetical protein GCM10011397_08880 [Wenyingzhuangia marina]SHH61411.1 hypothetical protein SAMN05444281_1209 [Wenyingzhuangia marina]
MKSKYIKLLASIVLDVIGMLPFFIPGLGEVVDIVWAPLSAYLIVKIYQNKVSKYTAVIGFIEEALPFADVVPTFTITWLLSLWLDKKD